MQNTIPLILGLLVSSLLAGCLNQANHFTNSASVDINKAEQSSQPNSIPTQCTASLWRPAVFREEPVKVLVYDGSASYSNIPAETVWSETKVQVEPSRYAQETEAAQYEEIEEVFEVERARSELYATPAQYHTVIREIVIQPTHRRWKQGCLASTNTSCLETVAPTLAKISTELIKQPALINQRNIPAKTLKVKRKKLIKQGKGIGTVLPARYETVKLLHVTKPWKIISSLVPAEYKTIHVQRQLRDEQMLPMPVTCTETLTSAQIKQIQQALIRHGQNLTLSGNFDASTIQALHTFQAVNNLAIGGLSLETLRKLGLA